MLSSVDSKIILKEIFDLNEVLISPIDRKGTMVVDVSENPAPRALLF